MQVISFVPSEDEAMEEKCLSNARVGETRVETYCVEKNFRITYLDMIAPIMSIIGYTVDITLDVYLAYSYYISEEYVYLNLTVVLILFSSLVNTVISARMYVADEDNLTLTKLTTKKWLLRMCVLCFHSALFLRHRDVLKYALRSWKAEKDKDYKNQHKYYELMVKEKVDAALLGLFESFLEAAPQQVLQAVLMLTRTTTVSNFTYSQQLASLGSSVFLMGLSMAFYQKAVRQAQQQKENLTKMATFIQFLWHFMVIASRILSMVVAAAMFPVETVVACFIHWGIMTSWLSLWEHTNFCYSHKLSVMIQQAAETLFCIILGLVYIFTYVTTKDGQNRTRFTIYYTICFIENILAAVAWTTADTVTKNKWYFFPLLIGCIVPFVIGIGFKLLYYTCFHPTMQPVKCCNASSNKEDEDVCCSSKSCVKRNSLTHNPNNESASEAKT